MWVVIKSLVFRRLRSEGKHQEKTLDLGFAFSSFSFFYDKKRSPALEVK